MSTFIVKVHAHYPLTTYPPRLPGQPEITEVGVREIVSKTTLYMAESVDINHYADHHAVTLVGNPGPVGDVVVINLSREPVKDFSKIEDYTVTDIFIENEKGKTIERISRGYL